MIALMKEVIRGLILETLTALGYEPVDFTVDHPEILSHGDYATNAALIVGNKTHKDPRVIATELAMALSQKGGGMFENVSVAGPGFVNFHLPESFFRETVQNILDTGKEFGKGEKSKIKTIVEYTDPNPFKEFHIGHLMSNSIGEAISRIIESQGNEVKRACYSGDKGLHVAKAVAYKLQNNVEWATIQDVALSYAEGSKLYETDEAFKTFVEETNKKIYNESDAKVNEIYMFGRKLTLDYFESLYQTLGTKFDYYFFESTTAEFGKAIVKEHTPKVFEESEGAIVYKGELRDPKLHTRVFINKAGLPTYEAKELGLAKVKYDTYPYDHSIVITGNEINDYFRVLMSALGEIYPELASKTYHIGHGMMRMPTGKMSSRTGDVITAEYLLGQVKDAVKAKMKEAMKDLSDDDALVEAIAVGALKFSILKQAPGRDIIFDLESATSFEGDSGPYVQYTNARIHSLMEKGKGFSITPKVRPWEIASDLEKVLYRFPEIVSHACVEYSPHHIATFLIEIASLFNAYYATNQIVDEKDAETSSHRLAIAQSVSIVLENGLALLSIKAPERM